MKTHNLDVMQVSQIEKDTEGHELEKFPSLEEVQDWILLYIANLLELETEEIDITVPFSTYGLDSSVAVGLTGDLADWLGLDLDPTLLYDYPTIESLVQYLSSELH
ncbi:acyl carrier protein [Nostoc punctiforme]|uniref:Phosphopantetheine-binding n=1 Tax=Nostoc punctiforme (strain ATCC 29133 / PCC 73102) TaxID=63737 RepID=B2J013_NOSP7|nr:acyl carrier protein [Nostoc punctiforme]ACC81784.1 phosphopantetheine-binding [Nostoc punctiforme PCC 73102]